MANNKNKLKNNMYGINKRVKSKSCFIYKIAEEAKTHC